MTKRKYGGEKPVGKSPERRCHFGGFCKPKVIGAKDPFTGQTHEDVVCESCGKSFKE